MTNKLHIYLRVSSVVQMEDGFGIENQKELGLKVSKIQNMEPIIHNEGSKSSHSDTLSQRPTLRNLLLKIEEGEVQNLWVYQMDRLSRNDVVSFQIRQKLKNNGVKLYVGDGKEYSLDNPNDKLMFTIMEGLSEFDNSIRTERLRRGKLSKVKKGGWRGGPTPFGYEIVDGNLKAHSYEKRWVKKIYEEFSEGSSIYGIKKLLMKNGVLSRRGNIVWADQSIRKILENTHYEGYHYYSDKKLEETVRCECPKIITSKLVKKVRNRLSALSHKSNYVKTVTLLKNFLVCKHCGSKFGQRINRSQYYNHYYCMGNTDRNRKLGPFSEKVCKTTNGRVRSVDIGNLDELVWNNVIDVLSKSHLFKESFKTEVMKEHKSFGQSQNERKSIQRKIKKIEKTIKELTDSQNTIIVDGIVDKNSSQLKPLLNKFEEKKSQLETEKEEFLELLSHNKKNTQWYDWVKKFGDRIETLKKDEMNTEDKHKFLTGILEKVVVETKDRQTHQVEIYFKSPYVGDIFEWNEIGKPKKGYKIFEGNDVSVIELLSIDKRLKKTI